MCPKLRRSGVPRSVHPDPSTTRTSPPLKQNVDYLGLESFVVKKFITRRSSRRVENVIE